MDNIQVITSTHHCRRVIENISKYPFVAVDLEGKSLGVTGKISIVQMAVNADATYIFDVFSNKTMMFEGNLKALFEDKGIIKIFHAASSDCGNLFHEFGVSVNNIFDTQCVCAVIDRCTGMEEDYVYRGLNDVARRFGVSINDHKDFIKKKYRRDPGFWLRRPLSEIALEYAAGDVSVLVPEVYNRIRGRAEELDVLAQAIELSIERSLIQSNPEEFNALRKKRIALEQEIIIEKGFLQLSSGSLELNKPEKRLLSKLNYRSEEIDDKTRKVLEAFALQQLQLIRADLVKHETSGSHLAAAQLYQQIPSHVLQVTDEFVKESVKSLRLDINLTFLRMVSKPSISSDMDVDTAYKVILATQDDLLRSDYSGLRSVAIDCMQQAFESIREWNGPKNPTEVRHMRFIRSSTQYLSEEEIVGTVFEEVLEIMNSSAQTGVNDKEDPETSRCQGASNSPPETASQSHSTFQSRGQSQRGNTRSRYGRYPARGRCRGGFHHSEFQDGFDRGRFRGSYRGRPRSGRLQGSRGRSFNQSFQNDQGFSS